VVKSCLYFISLRLSLWVYYGLYGNHALAVTTYYDFAVTFRRKLFITLNQAPKVDLKFTAVIFVATELATDIKCRYFPNGLAYLATALNYTRTSRITLYPDQPVL